MKLTDETIRVSAGLAGLAAIAAGCWFAWPPLAGIVVGALLLTGAVVAHLRSGGINETEQPSEE